MADQILPSGRTVTLVHLVVPVNGAWRIACMPGLADLHQTAGQQNYQRTDDIRAVTCPACKKGR